MIKFSLLSVFSSIVLIFAFMFGADIELYDIRLEVSPDSISIHPTFLCWIDTDLFRGMCYGNVMICDSKLPSDVHKTRIVAHEARHLDHFQALGFLVYPAKYFVRIEPTFTDWSDPSIELREMWNPPIFWPNQWDFIRLYW